MEESDEEVNSGLDNCFSFNFGPVDLIHRPVGELVTRIVLRFVRKVCKFDCFPNCEKVFAVTFLEVAPHALESPR